MYPTAFTDPSQLYHKNQDGLQHRTVFNSVLEKHLSKANNFALETLEKKREAILGVPDERSKRCCKSCRGLDNTYFGFSAHVGGGGNYYHGGRNDDSARALCMVGTLVVIAASAALGYCFGNYLNTQDEIKEMNSFEGYLTHFNINPLDPAHNHIKLIKDIFDNYSKLLAKRLERDRTNCFTASVLLVSGAVLGIGGAVGASGMMIAGGTVLIATVAATAFRVMFECQRIDNTKELARNINSQFTLLAQMR